MATLLSKVFFFFLLTSFRLIPDVLGRPWVETDECISACGLDRRGFSYSSDSSLDRQFIHRLCSPECYLNCPNVVNRYFSVSAEDVGKKNPDEVSSSSGSERSKLGGYASSCLTPPAAGRRLIESNKAAGGDASTPFAGRKDQMDSHSYKSTSSALPRKGQPNWR